MPSRWAVDVAGPVQALLPPGFVVRADEADRLEVRAPSGVSVLVDPGPSRRRGDGAPRAYAVRSLAARVGPRFRTMARWSRVVEARPAYGEAAELLARSGEGGRS